jgi:LysM repeat protein
MAPHDNDNDNDKETSSPIQRLLIGAGTLIVVVLTVIGAVFLAMQDVSDQGTPLAQTPTQSNTPVAAAASATPPTVSAINTPVPATSTPIPTPPATETATVTPSPTFLPATETNVPPTGTGTLVPPPTNTVPPLPDTSTPVPPSPPSATPVESLGACQPPAGWVSYEVQVGDTLNILSELTNSSVAELQTVNCLDSFTIRPLDIIFLPFTPPTVTPTPLPAATRPLAPTPTRTSTPIAPRINTTLVDVDLGENLVKVFVTGENFRSQEVGFRAELQGLTTIRLTLGDARTSTSFEATAPLDELTLGDYSLVVINPNGRLAIKENVYPPSNATPTPTPAPPEITRVSPSSGQISTDIRLTVQGRNFEPLEASFRVELQIEDGTFNKELNVDEGVRPATSTSFDVLVPAGELVAGRYDLLVTNPDGQTDIERLTYEAVE